MLDRIGRSQSAPDTSTDMITRATAVPALAALAVIHVVDLPGTLGPDRLVGIGYLGIIAVAIMAGGAMIARSHWLTWAAAGGLAAAAITGYVLTRALPARPRRAQRGDGDHPARGGLGLAYAGPRH